MYACCTTAPTRIALQYLAGLKKNNQILTIPNNEVYNELHKRLTTWDAGYFPELDDAHHKRSKEMHIIAAERKRARENNDTTSNSSSSTGTMNPRTPILWAPHSKKSNTSTNNSSLPTILSSNNPSTSLSSTDHSSEVPVAPVPSEDVLVRNRFRELIQFINETILSDTTINWAQARLKRTLQLLLRKEGNGTEGSAGIKPTARCYVLALYTAVEAQDMESGKIIMQEFSKQNILPFERLYEIMQPAFIQRLGDAHIFNEKEVHTLLHAEPNTTKWFFLKAAYEAMKGDQFGSKHGAVLIKDDKYVSYGHNHRFGVPDELHLRVMHSEIHSIVRMCTETLNGGRHWKGKMVHKPSAFSTQRTVIPSNDISLLRSTATSALSSIGKEETRDSKEETISIQNIPSTLFSWSDFIGSEIFIVELDGLSIGYECAIPCPMCNKGLIKVGISKAYYSSLDGIETAVIRHRADIVCESLDLSLKRIYPEGSTNPDVVYVTPQQLLDSLEEYSHECNKATEVENNHHPSSSIPTTDCTALSSSSSSGSTTVSSPVIPPFRPSYLRDDKLDFNELNDPGRRRKTNGQRPLLLTLGGDDSTNTNEKTN